MRAYLVVYSQYYPQKWPKTLEKMTKRPAAPRDESCHGNVTGVGRQYFALFRTHSGFLKWNYLFIHIIYDVKLVCILH